MTKVEKTSIQDMFLEVNGSDLSRSFRTFRLNHRLLSEYVLKDMIQKYDANRALWSSMGAFAENYLQMAQKWVEPFVAPYRPIGWAYNEILKAQRREATWEQWAIMVRSFITGELDQ